MRVLGLKIWNKLPTQIKKTEKVSVFKRLVKTWDGVNVT